jgi:hypothetical protein
MKSQHYNSLECEILLCVNSQEPATLRLQEAVILTF